MSKLDLAIDALRALPEDEQEQFAVELLAELSLRQQSALSTEQRQIVADRLARPFQYASAEALATVFQKY